MGLKGAASAGSTNDNAILQQVIKVVQDKGLNWSTMSIADKAEIFNPIAKAVLKK